MSHSGAVKCDGGAAGSCGLCRATLWAKPVQHRWTSAGPEIAGRPLHMSAGVQTYIMEDAKSYRTGVAV